jgi:hypothetical protein
MGRWAGAPGARGPGHFADRNPRHARPSKGLQSRIEIRDETRRTCDIKQRNALRHDATPMTLRFWFINDTDTCHYTGLKLGRKSETGREKRVTPEFGERKEEKTLPPNSGRYTKPLPFSHPTFCTQNMFVNAGYLSVHNANVPSLIPA